MRKVNAIAEKLFRFKNKLSNFLFLVFNPMLTWKEKEKKGAKTIALHVVTNCAMCILNSSHPFEC